MYRTEGRCKPKLIVNTRVEVKAYTMHIIKAAVV